MRGSNSSFLLALFVCVFCSAIAFLQNRDFSRSIARDQANLSASLRDAGMPERQVHITSNAFKVFGSRVSNFFFVTVMLVIVVGTGSFALGIETYQRLKQRESKSSGEQPTGESNTM